MFGEVFKFELLYHLRSRLFLFSALVFFLLTFMGVASPNVQFGSIGGANFNSPLAIGQSHLIMSIFAVLVGAAFLNNAALRDADFRMSGIIYSTSITRESYIMARFLGAFLACWLAYLATSLGFAVGSFMPWLDQELIGPFVFYHYAYASLMIGLPALFANAAIVYAVAVWTRDQRISYAAIIGLLVIYQVASAVLGQLEYRNIAALVDPTGGAALADAIQYWTIFERNSDVVPIEGNLLYNRVLWTGIGIMFLVLTYWRFRFETAEKTRREKPGEPADVLNVVSSSTAALPSLQATFTPATAWHQFLARVRFEFRSVLRSAFFWILLALAVANALGSFFGLSAIFGTELYPVTRVLVNLMNGTVTLSLMIAVVFYGAELVWRDREVRFQDILGSTPTPNWSFVLAKLVTALLIVVVFILICILVAIVFQLSQGYTRLELGLYLYGFLYGYGMTFCFVALLSVVIQILAPGKYLGMLLMVIYIISTLALPSAGWEDPLYRYGFSNPKRYSDMNGFDGQLAIASWYFLYWACFATLLGVLGYLLWTRGPAETLRVRIRNIGANTSRGSTLIATVAGLGFLATFSWIFYNTHVLNDYTTSDDLRARTAEYEKRYQHLEALPIPRFTDVSMHVDLYPDRQAFVARGEYHLENKTDVEIDEVWVGFNWDSEVADVSMEGGTVRSVDDEYRMYQIAFEPALQPAQRRTLSFTTRVEPRGFKHRNNIPDLLNGGGVFGNGSFVNSLAMGTYMGFAQGVILTDRADRHREGLEPVPRFADLDDESQWGNSYLRHDSDWVSFEMVVTTAADQIAIAPGYLREESVEGDRRRFHYQMEAPMQHMFSVLSGRYERAVEDWEGIELSVYYHADHAWNIERMMDSLKQSLQYFGDNFSPYQYRQMRILEFPAYANFAQAFPNTVPWSEGLGFIADLRDPESIDYVFYVGAHEVAHQWWGHQVSSANVQGQTSLVETLAQYSALMVMEREYGPHMMRRFLKFELDRYLSGRGGEAMEELPLYRVENQPYIHYRKGSVVMYALKDALGEEAINRALRKLIEEAAYRYNPYPTSRDLVRLLREQATTVAQDTLITQLFEKITLWDLKVEEATASARQDGRFDVSLTINAANFEAGGEGQQTEVPLDMAIDVGLFSQHPDKVTAGEGHVLQFSRQPITSGRQTLNFVVDELPSHAGIDPYNKLIDRNSDDNISEVSG